MGKILPHTARSSMHRQIQAQLLKPALFCLLVSFTVTAILEVLMMTSLTITVFCELTAVSTGKWKSARRVDCLTLKEKTIRCFKVSLDIYQSRRRNVLEDLKFLLLLLLFEFMYCQNILGLPMQIPYNLNLSDVPHCFAFLPCCQLLAYNV
jgi:hypothetical protein